MNGQLITALKSAVTLLESWEDKSGNSTVDYEIVTAKIHVQRAIEWEKGTAIEKAKP